MTVVIEFKERTPDGRAAVVHFGRGKIHCFLRKVNTNDGVKYPLNINVCTRTDLENATKTDWQQIGTLWFRPEEYAEFQDAQKKLGKEPAHKKGESAK